MDECGEGDIKTGARDQNPEELKIEYRMTNCFEILSSVFDIHNFQINN